MTENYSLKEDEREGADDISQLHNMSINRYKDEGKQVSFTILK